MVGLDQWLDGRGRENAVVIILVVQKYFFQAVKIFNHSNFCFTSSLLKSWILQIAAFEQDAMDFFEVVSWVISSMFPKVG